MSGFFKIMSAAMMLQSTAFLGEISSKYRSLISSRWISRDTHPKLGWASVFAHTHSIRVTNLCYGECYRVVKKRFFCPGNIFLGFFCYGGVTGLLRNTLRATSRVMVRVREGSCNRSHIHTVWHSKAVLCANFPPKSGTLQ